MVLQDAFQESGYLDLLTGYDPSKSEDMISEYGFCLEDFFDLEQKPDELLSIFISRPRDDLFLLLDGDLMDINDLCDEWDKRIRVFSIMNRKSTAVEKLQYNIVQLIIYSEGTPDKSREGNLRMSRKIIIKGDLADRKHIRIDDDEAIELPFHMIPADAFAPDEAKSARLRQLLPEDADVLAAAKAPQKRLNRKEVGGVQVKSIDPQTYETIRRWLEG